MATPGDDGVDQQVRLRSYQQEMLEESLKRNVIVAMDPGSGKTHIAIARIQAELELSDPGKVRCVLSCKAHLIHANIERAACVVHDAEQATQRAAVLSPSREPSSVLYTQLDRFRQRRQMD